MKVCKLVVQAPEAGLLAPDLVLYLGTPAEVKFMKFLLLSYPCFQFT